VRRGEVKIIQAQASDNVGVTKVEFYVNNLLQCSDTNKPYVCTWPVPSVSGASYKVQAVVFDSANNSATNTLTVTSDK
jgi:hypothetical protein